MAFDTSPDGILTIVSGGENPLVEFKTRFVERSIARHLAAFANSRGGILIIGVGDRGELLGLSQDEAKAAHERLTRLATSLLPSTIFRTGMEEINSKILVYAVIEEAPAAVRPIRLSTGAWLMEKNGKIIELTPPVPIESATKTARPIKIFVAMSFRNEEEPALVDYYEAMQRAVNSTDFSIEIVRIDLLEGDYEISQQIMNEIDNADIVLTDFTLSPANVYFELGYARGKSKRIIQSARKGTTLEFDARNWRTIFYKNATELEKALTPALNEACLEIAKK